MASSHTTIDHRTIRNWVEVHGGRPTRVRGTGQGDEDPGILRITFDDDREEELREQVEDIEWEQFFDEFEKEKLALIYEEVQRDGEERYFTKLVSREESIAFM